MWGRQPTSGVEQGGNLQKPLVVCLIVNGARRPLYPFNASLWHLETHHVHVQDMLDLNLEYSYAVDPCSVNRIHGPARPRIGYGNGPVG